MPIGAIAGLIGAGVSAFGSMSAADTSAAASRNAGRIQQEQYADISNKLLPWLQGGATARQILGEGYFGVQADGGWNQNAPFLQPISSTVGAPPSPTGAMAPPNPSDPNLASQFQQSPGYAYQLKQMTDATQNSAAGRTGAISGNMLRALQTNAGGLANQDYGNWYNNLVNSWQNNWNASNTNYNNRYQDIAGNRNQIIGALWNMAGSGQNAAVAQGGFGQQAATNIGTNLQQAAGAQAAGTLGGTNALANLFNNPSVQSGANNGLNYLFGSGYSNNPDTWMQQAGISSGPSNPYTQY